MKRCNHCDAEFETHNAYATHVRWKHKREQSQIRCLGCKKMFEASNVMAHEEKCMRPKQICASCGKETTNEKFCSKSCSARLNNMLGKTGYTPYRRNRGIVATQVDYRRRCLEHWSTACAVCGFTACIEIHHIDSNRDNNDVMNLIPLCPNHHTMVHMKDHRDALVTQIRALMDARFR